MVNLLKLNLPFQKMAVTGFKKGGQSVQLNRKMRVKINQFYQVSVLNDETGNPWVLNRLPAAQLLNA